VICICVAGLAIEIEFVDFLLYDDAIAVTAVIAIFGTNRQDRHVRRFCRISGR